MPSKDQADRAARFRSLARGLRSLRKKEAEVFDGAAEVMECASKDKLVKHTDKKSKASASPSMPWSE